MNTATIEIRNADNDRQETRQHRYARGAIGGAVDLTVSREWVRGINAYRVRWNANDGRGWRKGCWKATFMTEAEATAFSAETWSTLVTWLENLEPMVREFCPDFTC
jgi:hypothetical protein